MKVTPADVRIFRSNLRSLERVVNGHSKRCCEGVSQAQCHVLLQVDEGEESTTKELAKTLNLDASTISRTIDSLVKMKLVTRRENPKDRRSIVLRTTQKGETLCKKINADADEYFGMALNRIPSKTRTSVQRSFETLVKALIEVKNNSKGSPSCCNCKTTQM